MKVALVHDYINEFGGAERVLKVLTEMYPNAPVYTAFCVEKSTAKRQFVGKVFHESWLAPLLKVGKFYSPLRFLTPLVWGKMDLTDYDLVITSCSWYITRGFKIGKNTCVIAYCHTPPRWLYGYETSINFRKYWPVKVYAAIVGHFMRMYDWNTAQKPTRNYQQTKGNKTIRAGVDYFIANSENVKRRIEKFYRRDSVVIYPPVDVEKIKQATDHLTTFKNEYNKYFLIVSRLVGAKGIENAINAFRSKELSKFKLKIVGEAGGYLRLKTQKSKLKTKNIQFLGRVNDEELWKLYAGARGFIALARDEDFGITVVEAQAAGCPVIAFNGGGFKESVLDGVTGILIDSTDKKTIINAVNKLNLMAWNKAKLQKNAMKFSNKRFIKEMDDYSRSVLHK